MDEQSYSEILKNRVYAEFLKGIVKGKNPIYNEKQKQQKVEKKCLRDLCINTTTHNGGYCSPDCCRLDKLGK